MANTPALAIEQRFEFEFEGATVSGYIDRIGAHLCKDGFVITDFKTGKADKAGPPRREPPARHLLPGGAGVRGPGRRSGPCARSSSPSFAAIGATPTSRHRKWPVTERDEEPTQTAMRERLAELIARKRELNQAEVYRPNPYANCRFCDFRRCARSRPRGSRSSRSISDEVPALRDAPAWAS